MSRDASTADIENPVTPWLAFAVDLLVVIASIAIIYELVRSGAKPNSAYLLMGFLVGLLGTTCAGGIFPKSTRIWYISFLALLNGVLAVAG